MMNQEDLLAEFTAQLEEGLSRWDEVMRTGDTSGLEADMPAVITCYFSETGADRADVIDREGIIAGMRQSVGALRGCKKRFENRIIRMRSATEAVVFFEQVVEREGQVLARLLTMETYRRIDGRWQCIREVVEHAGA